MTDKELALILLPVSACYANPTPSHFSVGAIAKGESGAYFGANQEFCTTNIQQTTMRSKVQFLMLGCVVKSKITEITVNYTPCGHCRQFMNELNSAETLRIHLPHSQDNLLHHYLPDALDLYIDRQSSI